MAAAPTLPVAEVGPELTAELVAADRVARRRRLGVNVLLGLFLFGWLYGVPFLLLVGIERRMTRIYWLSFAETKHIGQVTDRYLIWGALLNLGLPAVGALVAGVLQRRDWLRRFGGAAIGAVAVYIVLAFVSSAATAPLIGFNPGRPPEPVAPTRCIPRSGGHSCPGG